ncbi:ABC-2 type transport system ATP-binding protein [Corynebacterium pollutisoli]|uniref:ABC-2 type transport system ATP-binding protein n=1 Tax=Corynebacterium pollutisoli TaxID=1610489 RepID=A0A1X7IU67_9CORY|nr:ABC transporter ATP-binding protein [Corynebacterium pollutisoli]SMG18424.1 ABC-2 type transport system ATP-binding protein [Corynebacterium pollutisoli]
MTTVIDVRDLTKTFGDFRALDNFNLRVEQGTIHGFLGPNGSGKSTTIRILLGVLHATSGTATVLGEDPRRNPAVLKRIGYIPGDVSLWPSLTGREVFRALESLRGFPVDREREAELIEAFKLDPDKKTREYSTGNRRKVSLVAALSVGAEAIILDEPTAGLDPLMEQVFVEQIRKEQARGATVLLSSHIMSEVEKLCEYVTIIRDGQTAETGSVEKLRHLSAHEITARVSRETSGLREIEGSTLDDGRFHVTVSREQVPDVLRRLLEAGGEDITSAPASIEEMFLQHYGDAR